MSWLFEDSTPIVVAAGLVEVALALALFKTGRVVIFVAMTGVLALALLCVLTEWLVVTPTEQIAATLDSVADALTADDVDGVVEHIDPAAAELRAEARTVMAMIQINEAEVVQLEVTLNERAEPPTARADFWGKVSLKDRTGQIPYERLMPKFSIGLRREGDRWIVTDYTVHDSPVP
jgi:hypothetical protein